MKTLNLKSLGKNDISFYLAVESYFLPRLDEDLFFLWDLHKAVICGKNQLLASEVNLEYTDKHKIKVFRRHTGGGAVYADEGCFMFTFLSKKTRKDEVYAAYLPLIQKSLQSLGLDVIFSGRNDLLLYERKFSGTAFLNNEFGSILHGTMMYDTDIERMVACLTPDDAKLLSKGISSVRQRVINLKEYLNLDIYGLMDYLYGQISTSEIFLTNADLSAIREIEQKYLSPDWLVRNNPPYTFRNRKRFSWGSAEIFIEVRRNRVQSLSLNGDFFTVREPDLFCQAFIDQDFTKENFLEILKDIKIDDYLIGAKNSDLMELIWEDKNEKDGIV
jgi:lipoate-protein ligase A